MAESDEWDRDPETGELLASVLSGFATACAPDGEMALLRLTLLEDPAVQVVLVPSCLRELIESLTALERQMVERQTPAGSA